MNVYIVATKSITVHVVTNSIANAINIFNRNLMNHLEKTTNYSKEARTSISAEEILEVRLVFENAILQREI